MIFQGVDHLQGTRLLKRQTGKDPRIRLIEKVWTSISSPSTIIQTHARWVPGRRQKKTNTSWSPGWATGSRVGFFYHLLISLYASLCFFSPKSVEMVDGTTSWGQSPKSLLLSLSLVLSAGEDEWQVVAGGERLLLTAGHLAPGGEVGFKHLCEPEIVVNLNLRTWTFLQKDWTRERW